MKTLSFIFMLFLHSTIFSQKVIELKNENYRQEIHGISQIGDKILIKSLPGFSCCFRYEKCHLRALLLQQVIYFIKKNPTFIFEVSIHRDSQGDDNYNLKLSQRIAESYKVFFIEHKISSKQVKVIGYGETQILNECKNDIKCSDEKHQENRRIEIKIIDINKS